MSSNNRNPEYSDRFIPLFDTPQTTTPSFIDISRPIFATLFDSISNDFYAHTRCPTDYDIQRIQVLCNPIVWTRYHTEKQIRRRRELERQIEALANTHRCRIHENNPRLVMDTLNATPPPFTMAPEDLFKDEILFHGTLKANIPSILTNGLDPRLSHNNTNMYGAGCYFSDSIEKCMQYVDDQTEIDQEYSILLCAVIVGRVMVEPEDRKARVLSRTSFFLPEGYDSAVEQDFCKEWVVFDKAQILPLCVIHFNATGDPSSYLRLWKSDLGQLSRRTTKTITVPCLTLMRAQTPTVASPSTTKDDPKFIDADSIDSQGEHPLLTDWKAPDPAMTLMIKTLLNIVPATCQVRLYFGGHQLAQTPKIPQQQQQQQREKTISNKLWIISSPCHFPKGPIGLSHEKMLLLKRMAGILKDLGDRQRKQGRSLQKLRDVQAQAIAATLCSVADTELLLDRWEDVYSLLEKEKRRIRDSYIDRFNRMYPGGNWRWDDTTKGRCQADIEVAERKFGDGIVGLNNKWTSEQVGLGLRAFEEYRRLVEQERLDNERTDNDRLKLEEETAVQRKFAASKIEDLGPDYVANLEEGLWNYQSIANKLARHHTPTLQEQTSPSSPSHQRRQQLVPTWVDKVLSVHDLMYRPQIFVELCLTSSMFATVTSTTDFRPLLLKAKSINSMQLLQHVDKKYMSIFQAYNTSILSSPSASSSPSSSSQLPELEWWNIVPMALAQAPTPSPKLWPVNPRTRLPTRLFYHLTDYIDWIFNKAHPATALTSTARPKTTITTTTITTTTRTGAWETMDPWIHPAIKGLSSRSGTVFYNRQQRQAEINKTQGDIFGSLFHKLPPSFALSTTAPVAPASKTRPSKVNLNEEWRFASGECAICSDLMLPGNGHRLRLSSQSNTSAIVRLHSCGHCYHEDCIKEWFSAKDTVLKCPLCSTNCTISSGGGSSRDASSTGANSSLSSSSSSSPNNGAVGFKGVMKLGPMPDAIMAYTFDVRLCCYIVLFYIPKHKIAIPNIPNNNTTTTGSSTNNSNNSSSCSHTITIKEEWRRAIIPFSPRLGPLLLIRLICAFYYGHFFRVGESITRGVENVVVWNGIHMRTAMNGAYGFPAPLFERECWREVDEKGVALGLEELVLDAAAVAKASTVEGGEGQVNPDTQQQYSTLLDRVFALASPLLFS